MAYKSKGTVRVESIRGQKLVFVPDNDHSVKNGNNRCAVFFNEGNNRFDRGKIVELDAIGRGVSVTLGCGFRCKPLAIPLLSSAAATQMKVEITVEISGGVDGNDGNVEFSDITLPAT